MTPHGLGTAWGAQALGPASVESVQQLGPALECESVGEWGGRQEPEPLLGSESVQLLVLALVAMVSAQLLGSLLATASGHRNPFVAPTE